MTNRPSAGSRADAPAQSNLPLIRDFLAWLAPAPRPYAEVMEAWRTSCPRLTIWEDAVDGGLVARRAAAGGAVVELTTEGRRWLEAEHGLAA